jgi:hypothetical protein
MGTSTNGHLNLGSIKHYNNEIKGYELYEFNSLVSDNDFFKKFEIEQEDYVYDLEPQSNNLFYVANFEEASNEKNTLFNVQYRVQSIEIPSLTYEYEIDQITKIPLIKNGKSSYEVSITWLEDVYHSIYSYHEKWLDSWYDYRHNLLKVGAAGRFRKCSIVTYHYIKSTDIFNPTYTAQPIMLIQLNGLVPKGLPSLKFSYSEDQSDQLLTLEYLCSGYNIVYNKDFADTNAEVWNPQLAFNKGFKDGVSNDQSEKERIIYAATGLTFSGESLANALQARKDAELDSIQKQIEQNYSTENKAAATVAAAEVVSEKTNNTKNSSSNSSTTTEDPVETAKNKKEEDEKKFQKGEITKAEFDKSKKAYDTAVLNQLKTEKSDIEAKNEEIDKQIDFYKQMTEGLYENDPDLVKYNGKIAELEKQKETNNILIKSKEEDIINQQNIINPPPKEPPETKTETKSTKEVVDSLDEEKKKDLNKLTEDDIKALVSSEIVNKQVSYDVAGNPTYSDFFVDEENTRYSIKDDDGNETFTVDIIQNHEGVPIGTPGAGLSVVVTNGTQYKAFGSDGTLKEAGTVNGQYYNASEEHWNKGEFLASGNNSIGKQMDQHKTLAL